MGVGYQRIAILFVSLLIQVGIIVGVFLLFPTWFTTLMSVATALAFFVTIYIMAADIQPEFKLPWILVITVTPLLGSLLFFVYGSHFGNKLGKQSSVHIAKENSINAELSVPAEEIIAKYPRYQRQINYLHNTAKAGIYEDTNVTYFPSGEAMWADMLIELDKAEDYIFMEYFIVEDGLMWQKIVEILKAKAKAGVDVRFMFDSFGSLFTAPYNFVKNLEKDGIACTAFNKNIELFSSNFNHRDHRKICVVDGKVGFTGGVNLADEYINEIVRFGHWKDSAIKLEGRGVAGLQLMFETIWAVCNTGVKVTTPQLDSVEAPGVVIPYTDYPIDNENVGETAYINMINEAEHTVWLTSPYLIISIQMISALTMTAKSGVDVRVIVPGIPDNKIVHLLTRSYYSVLQAAGVKVYEYTPGYMHAKMCIADREVAIVGTINLDYRSLTHHFENAVWMGFNEAVEGVAQDIEAVLPKCKRIEPKTSGPSNIVGKLLLPVLKVFAPLV